ncbi:MAG: universal stress protein [bacterium]
MYANVLIPVDGSAGSLAAVDEAIRLAPAVQKVHLTLVEQSVLRAYQLEGYVLYADRIVQARKQAGEDYLQPLSEKLEAAGIEVTTSVRFGESSSSIIRAARETEADLVLLGGREGGFLARRTGMAYLAPRLSRNLIASVVTVQERFQKAA